MTIGLKKYRIHILITLTIVLGSGVLDIWIQTIIALILIFSVGIIHGANDLQLIQKKTQKHSQLFFIKALLLYLFVVILGIGLFYFLPTFGLAFFVFFSAYHFGEQHLEKKFISTSSKSMRPLLYLAYGAALFGLLFTLQWDEVHPIIYFISGKFVSKQATELLFFGGVILFICISLSDKAMRKWIVFEIFLLLLLGWLFSRSSLLLAFGLYFVLWHSIPSMHDQLNYLYPNDASRIWKYLRSSAPYWVLSIVGLIGVYVFFDFQTAAFLPLFFSFLAAITFPHTVVMGWLKWAEHKHPFEQ